MNDLQVVVVLLEVGNKTLPLRAEGERESMPELYTISGIALAGRPSRGTVVACFQDLSIYPLPSIAA